MHKRQHSLEMFPFQSLSISMPTFYNLALAGHFEFIETVELIFFWVLLSGSELVREQSANTQQGKTIRQGNGLRCRQWIILELISWGTGIALYLLAWKTLLTSKNQLSFGHQISTPAYDATHMKTLCDGSSEIWDFEIKSLKFKIYNKAFSINSQNVFSTICLT